MMLIDFFYLNGRQLFRRQYISSTSIISKLSFLGNYLSVKWLSGKWTRSMWQHAVLSFIEIIMLSLAAAEAAYLVTSIVSIKKLVNKVSINLWMVLFSLDNRCRVNYLFDIMTEKSLFNDDQVYTSTQY